MKMTRAALALLLALILLFSAACVAEPAVDAGAVGTLQEAPVEEAPVEQIPTEETPLEDAPIERPTAEEAPVMVTLVEEAPTDEIFAEKDIEEIPGLCPEEIPEEAPETETGDEPVHALGLLEDDPLFVYEAMRSGNTNTAALPEVYDNAAAYPTPGRQGDQGSCVGWAVGYALRSHLHNAGRVPFTQENSFSPAYIYNQINGGSDNGSKTGDAMALVQNQGVCSIADMPYNEGDWRSQPNALQRAAAYPYGIDSYFTVMGLNDIKAAIITYGGVVFSISVYPDFDELCATNPVYDSIYGESRGRHAICLVGYDDTMQAFKLINSWGVNWGLDGFGYLSYALTSGPDSFGYVMVPKKEAVPAYTVQFNPGGGTGEMAPISATVGETITLPKNTFTNTNATFKGWCAYSTTHSGWLYKNSASGAVEYIADGSGTQGWVRGLLSDGFKHSILGTADGDVVILTAMWESANTYTVSFQANGGEGAMATVSAVYGNEWVVPNNQFTRAEHTFMGWYVYSSKLDKWVYGDDKAASYYELGSQPGGLPLRIYRDGVKTTGFSDEVNDSIILYAAWEAAKTFTVQFAADGGAGYMQPLSVGLGESFAVPPCAFTRAGYSFHGWWVYSIEAQGYLVSDGTDYRYHKLADPLGAGWQYVRMQPGDTMRLGNLVGGNETVWLRPAWV